MAEEKRQKTIHVEGSQVGIIGDNVHVDGGIHFHHHQSHANDTESAEQTTTTREEIIFDPEGAASILHLSDLHFGAEKNSDPVADAKNWHSQLTDDLIGELGCEQLHAVIISGDIGNFSEPDEYRAAEVFFERLCTKFGLAASQLIIVPGNHDLNWKLSKRGYRLMDVEDHDGPLIDGQFIRESENVIRLRDDDIYANRFRHFGKFHENVTGRPFPVDLESQADLCYLPELNLVIVGFNSVWEADHHFKKRISINPDALTLAVDQLRDDPVFKDCLKFAVWHHPLYSPKEDRIKDLGFMQRLAQAGFQVCLHGHIHKADAGLFRYDMLADGRAVHGVGAGTFGAPAKEWTPGCPLQYNLLRLSPKALRVHTRRRIELNGTWEPDHLWRQGRGKPNLPYYDIPIVSSTNDKSAPKPGPPVPAAKAYAKPTDAELEAEIRAYRAKAESLHENLPVAGFASHLKVPIDIEDIYIPLRAVLNLKGIEEHECYGDALDAEKRLAGCDRNLEIRLVEAFPEARQRNQKGLVILGDPGSGKTSHMKRMLLWCLRKGPESLGLPKGMLPVFLPLRELHHLEDGLDRFIQDQLTSRHLKMRTDFGRRLMKRGNLLFLLDGLDEVADLTQREAVSVWIEEAFTDYPDCRFVVTCRFAGYSPTVRLGAKFLEMHVRPLSEKEAERFVHNWYAVVEKSLASDVEQAASIAREKADHLNDRLRQPDFRARRVYELTRNPLLLTNICLVHRHRGALPQRRARLYEECIDVLLEHWRQAKELALGINALQGRLALQPAALWLHQKEGRTRATADELTPYIEPVLKEIRWPGGDTHDFLRIIRDESGLLTGWDQENYGFMHLGFQEFLAAREIRSRFQQEMNETGRSNLLKNLAGHFGESWWQEVTLLLLALEDPPLFVPFMREVVGQPAFAKDVDLMEMCLDDAVKPSPLPFIELLETGPGKDPELWRRQLLALRMAARLDGKALESIIHRLKDHPFDKIRQWIEEKFRQARQDVIRPEPSGYELVLIKGGTFLMGSDESEREQPVYEVTLPDFYMGRYPVTNEEYGRFLKATGHEEPGLWGYREYNQPRQPVVGVSWHDANQYAQWAKLQLPSEAQWEFACRAGTTTRYHTGDSEADLDRAGWYRDNSGNKLHAVGEKAPNAFGLYDMHGNVYEWCQDDWHDNYEGAPANGRAWVDRTDIEIRVLRGGAWNFAAEDCRTAKRFSSPPAVWSSEYGFRLACLPGQPGEPGKRAGG
ncbi:SUMF1/EgtB/PvdO family nonheme iron enzyme [Desulfosarcina ovata]|uniref:NACHT domain-containing protein n=1 Tax=Desulfosarcina ovata subsp. ovata TaxID=2752305 RepID=A0A5K8AH12_9BACT|nr:SUMF1/EgtB/PvdO family nonheme iron enzyme [Desulfosarcina ovata]BBO91150.1 hypothetical protein DSCOOX_43300 [Desulfosarcina ovata subsp. ovata]